MTNEEKKVFVNWKDDDFGTVEHVIVTSDTRDANAICNVTSVPVICLPWNERAAAWLRTPTQKSRFAAVKEFLLAGRGDFEREPGTNAIANELGVPKCKVCNWGEFSCAADLISADPELGADSPAFSKVLAKAVKRPYIPIGLVTVSSILPQLQAMMQRKEPDNGLSVHWGKEFDEHCRFNMGSVAIVVGKEGEGKSSWVDELLMRLTMFHNLKVSIWTPEAMYMETHSEKLIRLLYQRKDMSNLSQDDFYKGVEYLNDHFYYIDFPYPEGYELMTPEEKLQYQPTLDNLITKACNNAEIFGCRIFVFDPVLVIQKNNPRQRDFDFYRDLIEKAKFLASKYNALVILVTHPHRIKGTDLERSDRPVTKNDIFGSSLFAYLLDYVFAINRYDKSEKLNTGYVSVEIGKVKQQRYGTRGMTYFTFQKLGERFNPTTMRDVETKNGKGTTHIEPAQTYVNPKRWLDKEGKPDLAALEFQLPVNMVNGERLKDQGEGDKEKGSSINHAPGSARRSPLRGENPEPVNHEPSKENQQLSMDSLLDDAAQNQNPSLPD